MEKERERLRWRMTPHDQLRVQAGRLQLFFRDGTWRDVLRIYREKRKGWYWLRGKSINDMPS